jgi:hypothetical protein
MPSASLECAPWNDYVGVRDAYGNELQVTAMAVADEIAAAADLAKGKLRGRPVAVVRGLAHLLSGTDSAARELLRDPASDMFGYGSQEAVLAAALAATRQQQRFEELVALDGAERTSQLLAGATWARGCGSAACDHVCRLTDRRSSAGRDRLATPSDGSVGANQVAKAKSDDKAAPNGDASTKGPSSAQSRRDKLASLETARKKEQRTRTIRLLVICLVLAIGLLAYPVYLFAMTIAPATRRWRRSAPASPRPAATPSPTHPATGNQEHVAEGTKVDYAQTPPDSGKHYPTPAPFTKALLRRSRSPPVETLVHNLEHGYTVVWYRATPQQANQKSAANRQDVR